VGRLAGPPPSASISLNNNNNERYYHYNIVCARCRGPSLPDPHSPFPCCSPLFPLHQLSYFSSDRLSRGRGWQSGGIPLSDESSLGRRARRSPSRPHVTATIRRGRRPAFSFDGRTAATARSAFISCIEPNDRTRPSFTTSHRAPSSFSINLVVRSLLEARLYPAL